MKINGIKIDESELMTKDELLHHLEENGATDRALDEIRGRNFEQYNNELTWKYPITDDEHEGVVIVVIKEGFLSLPYYEITKDDYELFELNHAAMFDEESLQNFIEDWVRFSDDLRGALGDMLCIVKGAEPKIPAERRMSSDRLEELFENILTSVSDLYEGGELYNLLHFSFGMSNKEIEKQGFEFQRFYLASEKL